MTVRKSAFSTFMSIVIIVACIGAGIGLSYRIREAHSTGDCPCSASAAMVVATGSTITAYVEAWIAYVYILLANNFSSLNSQIVGNTQSYEEGRSYQVQVVANIEREKLSFRQNIRATEDPDHKFQATVAAVSGGAQATQYSTQQAIEEQNIEWLRGLTTDTNGSDESIAAQNFKRTKDKYCNQRLADLGLCTLAEEAMQDANSKAETIFGYDVLSDKFRDAAIDFCRSLVGNLPAPVGKPTNSPKIYVQVGDRYSHDARMAEVLHTCGYLVSLRAEVKDSEIASWATQMRRLISGLEDGVPDYLSSSSPEAVGSSMEEIMQFAATYRASNSKWYAYTQTMADPVAVWKQIAAMRATMLFLRWQRYEIQQINAGTIASISAAETELSYDDNASHIKRPANF